MKQLSKYANDQVKAGNFKNVMDVYQFIADKLGLKSQSSVRLWAYGVHKMPAIHALKLEKATGIPRYISCPELFDAPAA